MALLTFLAATGCGAPFPQPAAVERNGAASDAQILATTSPLFVEPARRCALAHYYEPARDREGRRVEGWTAPFKMRYVPSTER
jgi:hypothetical protein